MYTRILILPLFFVLAWVVNSYGQPPNPPIGWEYVRSLDSLTIDEFHAVGDTIFMFGFDNHVSVKRGFKAVSYDGGNSWDSVMIPPEISESYRYGVFPTEAKIWLSYTIDEKRRFYISKDGKNYEWFEIGKDTTAGLGFSNFFIDPKDPNHWIIIGSFKLGLSKNSRLSQSFDAGRSWKVVNVPTAPAEQLTMELVFDARREGVWYVRVTAEPHVGQGTVLIERTTNNGETFEEIKQWGTHYGIGYPGEVRRWWGYSEQRLYGPLLGNEMDDTLKPSNWLQKFHPSLPLSEPLNGYWRWLPNYKEQFLGNNVYYPSNYLIFDTDPLTAVVVEREIRWDTNSGKSQYVTSWIHITEDDWNTWRTIWESGPNEWAHLIFLDKKTPSLWSVTKFRTDTTFNGYTANQYTSYLYKHSLTSSAVDARKTSPIMPLKVYPSPTISPIKVLIPNMNSAVRLLELCTAEGIVIVRTANDFFLTQGLVEWSIPEYVPSGLYFLKIHTDNSPYLVKVILQR